MARIKLIVAYDGTDYVGWQYQPNGISVQQRLEEAVQQLTGTIHTVYSSGRTDSGVHARGMACHLTTEKDLPLSAWREGVNRFLPDDIAVRHVELVDDQFHARFSARGKHYRYTILRDPVRSPQERKISWQVKKPLDLEKMEQAAQDFIGQQDFAAFRTSGCTADTTIREIFSIDFSEEGSLLQIDICGSGFLRNMIRMMVGTLVQIGRCKRPVDAIQKLLEGTEPVASPLTAPAQGLCLMEVWF
ncbi:MAG: tRNA pseudouridine(38-40) synthase TruA [Deltaproteobacteria bacterium]|nr:MAG: tRNA pseudouridine(38-40) synthase TruA [Deltaproteobacteria bacterium]RLB73028.1 MAG: tRNA pseudouridine(38-40) synthase TruA [Deltaproteobacteria bacterium]